MLIDKMPAIMKPTDPVWTTSVVTYEHGHLVQALIRAQTRGKYDEKLRKSYLAQARISLADAITQYHVLAEQMGWKWIDLENDGRERFLERASELARIDSQGKNS